MTEHMSDEQIEAAAARIAGELARHLVRMLSTPVLVDQEPAHRVALLAIPFCVGIGQAGGKTDPEYVHAVAAAIVGALLSNVEPPESRLLEGTRMRSHLINGIDTALTLQAAAQLDDMGR